jgi:pimeloyl-ACP methyl ester carboxylesterase
LRKALNQKAGYHTVSVQLPKTTSVETVTRETKIAEMKAIYQESRDIIRSAATFLADEHGVKRLYLLAHSMGATIVTTLVTQDGPVGFAGLVLVGTGDYEEPPFNTTVNLGQISKQQTLPVLDVFGDTAGITHPVDASLAAEDVRLGAMRKSFASTKYRQEVIPGGGHVFFGSRADPLVKLVAEWIAAQEAASSK